MASAPEPSSSATSSVIPTHYPASVQAALRFVQATIDTKMDASHDLEHILRVVGMAARLAEAEGFEREGLETALLVAALHDIGDSKYCGEAEGRAALRAALDHLVAGGHVRGDRADRIEAIVRRVGFKESLAGGANNGNGGQEDFPELAVVNDADQLDAIGAIGIARCFTFGGARGRPLYDPATLATGEAALPTSKEAYAGAKAKGKQDTVTHFYEKLLHLKDRMRTAEGRRVAAARHTVMVSFLDQLRAEVAQDA